MKTLLVLVTLVAAIGAYDPLIPSEDSLLEHMVYWNPYLIPVARANDAANDAEAKEEQEKVMDLVSLQYPSNLIPVAYFNQNPYLIPVARANDAEAKEEQEKVMDLVSLQYPSNLIPVAYNNFNQNPYLLSTFPFVQPKPDAVAMEARSEIPDPSPDIQSLPVTHHGPDYTVPLTLQNAGCQNNMGQAVPCAYGNLVLAGVQTGIDKSDFERKKRSAESEAAPDADPEADPFFYYAPTYYSHRPWYGLHSRPYYYNHYYYNLPVLRTATGCQNYLGSLVPCA